MKNREKEPAGTVQSVSPGLVGILLYTGLEGCGVQKGKRDLKKGGGGG